MENTIVCDKNINCNECQLWLVVNWHKGVCSINAERVLQGFDNGLSTVSKPFTTTQSGSPSLGNT